MKHISMAMILCLEVLKPKNDMVTTETSIPDGNGRVIKVNVWGKIASVNCSNGWFPRQVAQEMALQKINIEDTPLPDSQNELICKVNILGYTKKILKAKNFSQWYILLNQLVL